MPKKLYEVMLERLIYVIADDEREARHIAEANERECEPSCNPPREITSAKEVEGDWLHAHPYDSEDGRGYAPEDPTCAEFFQRKGD